MQASPFTWLAIIVFCDFHRVTALFLTTATVKVAMHFDVCVSKAVDLFFFSLAERVPIYEITSLTSVHLVKLLQPTRPYQRQKLKVFSFLNSILCSLYYSFFFTSDSNGVSKSVSSFMSPVLKCFSRPRLPAARQSHKKHH